MTKKEPYFQKVGKVAPLGMDISQSWNELGAIESIIHDFGINFFVELGVHRGGLATYLATRARLNSGFEYLGVEVVVDDIAVQAWNAVKATMVADILVGDIFHPTVINIISKMIRLRGRTLVYCDNGDKPREFELYSSILKDMDIIMVHDYPKEFNDDDFGRASVELERQEREYLEQTHIVLFKRTLSGVWNK